jgi:PadR family transcriptional regulator
MISKELVGASARSILLSILSRGDSYGYAILKKVHTLSDGKVEWKDGMLYPVLHRLEDEKLIESFWMKSDSGRRRKYYRLLPKGLKALEAEKKQWLQVDAVLAALWGLEPRVAAS